MPRQPDNNPNGGTTADDIPTTLSRTEYREWVHSQVANQMAMRIGAYGVGLLAVVLATSVGIHAWFLRDTRDDIETAVVLKVEPTIRETILVELIDRTKLVEEAKTQINTEVQREVTKTVASIFDSDEFVQEASTNLNRFLKETGGPQDLILNNALERASDKNESERIRAFGLQLYTLLHAGKRASRDVEPMRKMFAQILGTAKQKDPLPPKLLIVILEHYPLGEHGTDDRASECMQYIDECKEWDAQSVTAILSILDAEQEYPGGRSCSIAFSPAYLRNSQHRFSSGLKRIPGLKSRNTWHSR